jgi:hypothetical protein
MDLTPPAGSDDPTFCSSGFVPGWTSHGYKGYSGYAWYRLRVADISGTIPTGGVEFRKCELASIANGARIGLAGHPLDM